MSSALFALRYVGQTALHAGGRRFDPGPLHFQKSKHHNMMQMRWPPRQALRWLFSGRTVAWVADLQSQTNAHDNARTLAPRTVQIVFNVVRAALFTAVDDKGRSRNGRAHFSSVDRRGTGAVMSDRRL